MCAKPMVLDTMMHKQLNNVKIIVMNIKVVLLNLQNMQFQGVVNDYRDKIE